MVSQEEISEKIKEILEEGDLAQITKRKIKETLEKDLGEDLSEHKKFINAEIEKAIEKMQADGENPDDPDEEEPEDEEDDEEEEEEDDDDDDDDHEPPTKSKRKAPPKKAPPAKKAKKEGGAPRGGGGFNKLLKVSQDLKDFLGPDHTTYTRPALTKAFWAYFKKNNLQDPADKRQIICDPTLKKLLKVERFTAFGLQKYLKDHILG